MSVEPKTPLPSPAALKRPVRLGVVSHLDAIRANSGITWGLESWEISRKRQNALEGQTSRLADILERNGIRVRLPSEVTTLGEVTGGTSRTEAYRPIRFLPSVAQRDRRPVLNGLKLWLRSPANRWCRYAVVTSGTRVPLMGDLKARQKKHTRDITRWAHEAQKDFGVEVIFRGTEYTVEAEGIHLHSNIVYKPIKKMSKDDWTHFLEWSHQRLKCHWKDCGILEDASEVVKYALKPAELNGLSDEVICWLHGEMFRAKLCQPMRSFADWLDGLQQERLKVAMVRCGEKSTLKLVQKMEKPEPSGQKEGPGENVILGRILPVAKFCQWAEPLTLVANFTENPATPQGVRRLEAIRLRQRQAREFWDANGAPCPSLIKVHTDRPTVQTSDPRHLVTQASGHIIDGDTGEVLYSPPVNRARKQAEERQRDQERRQQAEVYAIEAAREANLWQKVVDAELESRGKRRRYAA